MWGTRVRPAAYLWAALAGMLVGHTAGYAVAYDDPHVRTHALTAAGHAYLPSARLAAVAGLALLLLWAVSRGVERRRGGQVHSIGSAVALLSAAQVMLFTGAEVGERLIAGASVSELMQGPLLPLGLLLQPVVAAAMVALTAAVERLAAVVVPPAFALPTLIAPALVTAEGATVYVLSRHQTPQRGRAPPRSG